MKKKMLVNEIARRKAERKCIDYIHTLCKGLNWNRAKEILKKAPEYEDLYAKYFEAYVANTKLKAAKAPNIRLSQQEREEIWWEMWEGISQDMFEKAFNLKFV